MPETNIKARFDALVEAYSASEDDLLTLERCGDNIMGYVKHVEWMDRNTSIWRARLDPAEYRDHYTAQDRIRSSKHELTISATQRLNTMAEQVGVDPVFAGNASDRYAVAAFAAEFCSTFYEHGRSRETGVTGRVHTPTPARTIAVALEGPEI